MTEESEVKVDKEKEEKAEKFRLRSVVLDQDALFLREESKTVILGMDGTPDDDTLELIQEMKRVVMEKDALGLAAVQLGQKKRVFVMRRPFNSMNLDVIINPRIIRGHGHSIRAEGCLSIDYFPSNIKGARVKRMSEIFVEFTDVNGHQHTEYNMVGMDARVFQHELDHLNGKLMIDEPGFQGMERAF